MDDHSQIWTLGTAQGRLQPYAGASNGIINAGMLAGKSQSALLIAAALSCELQKVVRGSRYRLNAKGTRTWRF